MNSPSPISTTDGGQTKSESDSPNLKLCSTSGNSATDLPGAGCKGVDTYQFALPEEYRLIVNVTEDKLFGAWVMYQRLHMGFFAQMGPKKWMYRSAHSQSPLPSVPALRAAARTLCEILSDGSNVHYPAR